MEWLDNQEVEKFQKLANQWWDLQGPLKTLHNINPCRMQYIQSKLVLAGKTVLDVGCGGGILSEALSKAGACVSALDVDSVLIAVAADHAKQQQLDIAYYCMPIQQFEHAKFDVVVCMELLEHVPEPKEILYQCARLLKPGGLLFLSTISRNWMSYVQAIVMAEYVLKLIPKQTHDYQKLIKPSELARWARDFDYTMLNISGFKYNPFTHTTSLCTSTSVNYFMTWTRAC